MKNLRKFQGFIPYRRYGSVVILNKAGTDKYVTLRDMGKVLVSANGMTYPTAQAACTTSLKTAEAHYDKMGGKR